MQQGIPALGDDLPIEHFAAALMCGSPQFGRVLRIAQQHAHGICETFDVIRINQEAGLCQYLGDPASSRSDDRSRTGHRFGIDQTKGLLEN